MRTLVAIACGALVLAATAAYAGGGPFVGMELRPLGADVASYLGIESGVLVGGVMEKSPAEAAGLKINDIIVSWNGEAVASPEALVAKVKASTPGQEAKVKIVRKGVEHELACKIGTREGEAAAPPVEAPGNAGYLGVAFDMIPPMLREYLGLEESVQGVYIVEVLDSSPAAKAGLKERDIILKVNGEDLAGPEAFQALMSGTHAKDVLTLEGLRAGRELKMEAVLEARPAGFEKKMRPPLPMLPSRPGEENFRDRFTLKFKDANGKEHVIPFPSWGPSRDFHFEMPTIDWPESLGKDQIQDLEARVREAMKEAMKRIEEHSKDLKQHHGAFLRQIEKLKGSPSAGHSVVVSEAASQVTSSDGTHEITINTSNGAKTVTVKEGGKVLASDLPFEQIGTLSEEVRKKIKDLDGSVIIRSESRMSPSPAPAEKKTEKDTHKAPVDVQVPAHTL